MKLNLKNKVYLKSMVMPIVTHIVRLHALPTDSPKEGAVILTSATQHMKGKYIFALDIMHHSTMCLQDKGEEGVVNVQAV